MKFDLTLSEERFVLLALFRRAQFTWFAAVVVLFSASSKNASAHGELEIQIAAVTKKIQTATNNTAQLYLDRAELHREHQDWDAARLDYDRAAELDPKLAVVDFFRAKMLDDSGQLEAARVLFDKFISRNPKEGEAFVGRARVLVKLNQPKPAVADFRQGLQLLRNPKAEYFLELAQVLTAQGETNDALHTLDGGIKNFGPIVPLQLYALELELGRKNNNAALARLDTIIERADRKESWLARRGEILLASGQPAEAQKAFEAALAAIKLLPSILQNAPPMQKLQTKIKMTIEEIQRRF